MQQSFSSAEQAEERSQALDRRARPPVVSFDPYFQRRRTRWIGEVGCTGSISRANSNWSDYPNRETGNGHTERSRSDDPSLGLE
jgi:hypothetical protein